MGLDLPHRIMQGWGSCYSEGGAFRTCTELFFRKCWREKSPLLDSLNEKNVHIDKIFFPRQVLPEKSEYGELAIQNPNTCWIAMGFSSQWNCHILPLGDPAVLLVCRGAYLLWQDPALAKNVGHLDCKLWIKSLFCMVSPTEPLPVQLVWPQQMSEILNMVCVYIRLHKISWKKAAVFVISSFWSSIRHNASPKELNLVCWFH